VSKNMTVLGIAPKLGIVFFVSLFFTLALQLKRPELFTITQVPYPVLIILGALFIIIGLLLWASSARVVDKAFKEGKLLTTGIYGIVRNPLYSGLAIFFSTGLALCLRSWVMLIVPVVSYIAFKLLIPAEDKYLLEKFGQQFLEYKSSVNAIIPFPHFIKSGKK
jgi:protein-S-isoprenylcysteine O-methyltransferase Ste14